ncbi:hypothetical protein GBL_0900 [Geobacillus kaustophilus GBlys]|uniref:Uncharacterized protein n=1 Tax=Geobacillus kaustophilus GBlys TaxID=1337888 RepID=U2Y7S8_GEOKU|nr:hypothetical protein GBL_0900 [Geobacillus kaustophilus GBlys]
MQMAKLQMASLYSRLHRFIIARRGTKMTVDGRPFLCYDR